MINNVIIGESIKSKTKMLGQVVSEKRAFKSDNRKHVHFDGKKALKVKKFIAQKWNIGKAQGI